MSCENCPCWEEASAEDLEAAIENLCVERDGKCVRGEDCRCKNEDVAEKGNW